jgi:hypothetical protein
MAHPLAAHCNPVPAKPHPTAPFSPPEELAVRHVFEPSLAVLSRWTCFERAPRMRSPSPLPTILPTKSSYWQRFVWLITGQT